MNFLKIILIH